MRLAEHLLRLVRGGGRLGAAPAWLNIKSSSLASPEVAKKTEIFKIPHTHSGPNDKSTVTEHRNVIR